MTDKPKKQTDGHIGRQVNVRLKDEDAARLDRLVERFGGVAPAIKAAMRALDGANTLTDQDLLDMIAARFKAAKADETPKSVKENQMQRGIHTPPKR